MPEGRCGRRSERQARIATTLRQPESQVQAARRNAEQHFGGESAVWMLRTNLKMCSVVRGRAAWSAREKRLAAVSTSPTCR